MSNMLKSHLIIQNKMNSICIKYISKFVSAKNVHIPSSLYEGSIQKNVNGMKSSSWNKRKLNQHFFPLAVVLQCFFHARWIQLYEP